jgi:hypothetical protein
MNSKWIPFVFVFAILAVVLTIVLRDDKSLISKCVQMMSRSIEGFASPLLDNPRCPTGGYNFFTDKRGESFCCRGAINPYTHTCEVADESALCAFRPNTVDPRNRHHILPLCSSLIMDNHTTKQASCPGSLPNYASIGKCCLNNPDMDDYDCTAADNADKSNYCKLAGPLADGEQLCGAITMMATATCPKEIPGVVLYKTGARESAAYGAAAGGVGVPVCMGMDNLCIPDSAISYLQGATGLYKDKNIPNWAYSCSGWSKVNVAKDKTVMLDKSYIGPAAP